MLTSLLETCICVGLIVFLKGDGIRSIRDPNKEGLIRCNQVGLWKKVRWDVSPSCFAIHMQLQQRSTQLQHSNRRMKGRGFQSHAIRAHSNKWGSKDLYRHYSHTHEFEKVLACRKLSRIDSRTDHFFTWLSNTCRVKLAQLMKLHLTSMFNHFVRNP